MSTRVVRLERPRVPECVFCDLIAVGAYDALPGSVARFAPLNPVVEGHMLFVPLAHVMDARANPGVAGRVVQAAAEWAARFGFPCNIITSCGAEATQTVFHLHVHYVPRRRGDGLPLPWTPQQEGRR